MVVLNDLECQQGNQLLLLETSASLPFMQSFGHLVADAVRMPYDLVAAIGGVIVAVAGIIQQDIFVDTSKNEDPNNVVDGIIIDDLVERMVSLSSSP